MLTENKNWINSWKNFFNQFYVKKIGVKKIKVFDFNLEIDIPKKANNQIGTYTVKTEEKKLQISGVIVMQWKIIRLDL